MQGLNSRSVTQSPGNVFDLMWQWKEVDFCPFFYIYEYIVFKYRDHLERKTHTLNCVRRPRFEF